MARFELTMTARYARDWGVREGLREIVQNALDGQDSGYPMVVGFQTFNGHEYLTIQNRGLVLDKSAWLLGKSDKHEGARGRHGDGLKVGTLALIRQGIDVFFLNGSERWTPTLETSETFNGETVMVIQSRSGSARNNDFTVGIQISKDQWETYRQDFLPLSDVKPSEILKGGYAGNLITNPAYAGKIFAKGIYVCTKDTMKWGYDLHDVTLDRDRRILDTWDVQYQTSKIHVALAAKDDEIMDQVFEGLKQGLGDVEHFHYFGTDETNAKVVSRFAAQYGEKAVAVDSAAEAERVEYFGFKGVVVPRGLRDVMVSAVGTTDKIVAKAMDTCGAYLKQDELDPETRKTWSLAVNLLILAGVVVDKAKVRLYDFNKVPTAPRGTYNIETGEIRINPAVLSSGPSVIVTLAHELAHQAGRDGTLDHRAREERILEDVLGTLLSLVDTNWIAEA